MPLEGDIFNRNVSNTLANNGLSTVQAQMVHRFSKVAYLASVRQLDIHGTIGTEMLSPKTEYAPYLVLKLANTVHLARFQESGDIPKMRGDGWMKVELGYFNSKKGSDGPVEARLFEKKHIYKRGLIVEGIEFRPK
ncbi:putative F-box protein PP2-B2 [Solanum dulcamara]|uniref:putative F-box protein PP2-B2 n=1 Tax=Solanum dulcamara TaxID=45834 RepID=UPI002485D6D5|nr:putative F-box protein PP2-B2 [Solanum dulcamara]